MNEFHAAWFEIGFYGTLGSCCCLGLLSVLKFICNAIGACYRPNTESAEPPTVIGGAIKR